MARCAPAWGWRIFQSEGNSGMFPSVTLEEAIGSQAAVLAKALKEIPEVYGCPLFDSSAFTLSSISADIAAFDNAWGSVLSALAHMI